MDTDRRITRRRFHEALANVTRKFRKVFDERVSALGLTYPRAHLLYLLIKHDRLTQSGIGVEMEIENPTVVRLVDAMERHDLIRREPVPDDRRVKTVVLTEHGRRQGERVAAIADELRAEVMAGIDAADLEASRRLFERMAGNIETLGQGAGYDDARTVTASGRGRGSR